MISVKKRESNVVEAMQNASEFAVSEVNAILAV